MGNQILYIITFIPEKKYVCRGDIVNCVRSIIENGCA